MDNSYMFEYIRYNNVYKNNLYFEPANNKIFKMKCIFILYIKKQVKNVTKIRQGKSNLYLNEINLYKIIELL